MKKKKTQRGFTLIESLVSIGILVIAILATYTAAQAGISTTTYAKEQLVAFNLAQEAVEQIRNMSAENRLNGLPWLNGIAQVNSDNCYFGKTCRVDIFADRTISCSQNACPFIREDTVNGFYGYDNSWPLTVFKRDIQITSINAHEVSIMVTITWSKGLATSRFKVRDNITDWQG
jgi:prepilin-type N-terminal cleavage/methylation domain-containing protein